MVERLVEAQSVVGSSPTTSTNLSPCSVMVSTACFQLANRSSILRMDTNFKMRVWCQRLAFMIAIHKVRIQIPLLAPNIMKK
jgi:hypothetical protein